MADLNKIVSGYIKARLNAAILDNAYAMSKMAACAGIKGNAELIKIGRINNYGTYTAGANKSTHIPARPWLDAGVGESDALPKFEKMYIGNLMGAINSSLKDSRFAGIKVTEYTTKEGTLGTTTARVQPRFTSVQGIGPSRIMMRIAKAMFENQKSYISDSQGDKNKPSTIERKGFDHPLYKDGKLLNAITYWVQDESNG